MATTPGAPWWEDFNDGVRRAHETGWGSDVSVLSSEICQLLEDVDREFAVTGAATPGWPNPYPDGAAPAEEAYERLTDPGKFLIVVARAQAWVQVLLGRGWAREASEVRWALRPSERGGADTVLRPAAVGAVPLVSTTHSPVNDAHIFTVTADGYSIRSSFGGHGGTVQTFVVPTAFTAAPWAANWSARPIPG